MSELFVRLTEVPSSKVCPTCKQELPAADFGLRRPDGFVLQSSCTPCRRKKTVELNRIRRRRFPEEDRQRQKVKDWRIRYGLTPEGYANLLAKQGGACAICRAPEPGKGHRHFCVDHHHETKQVRGLLCHSCNRGIGLLGDDADRVTTAAEYLRNPPNQTGTPS